MHCSQRSCELPDRGFLGTEAFAAIAETAYAAGGLTRGQTRGQTLDLTPPYMTEAWYCCAEPGPEQIDLV